MKCCECVYKKTFSICGNDNSPFFNKEVGATQSCEFFKENPAQIHFSNGMKNSLSNNLEEAVKEFELALEGELPEDDEVLVRAQFGSICPELEKWDDGYMQIEKAIMLDSQKKLNIFKNNEGDRLSTFNQFSILCILKSREIKEELGLDSAISFIQEKLNIVEYLPGKYMPGLHYELASLYLDKADEKNKTGYSASSELDLHYSSLKNCLEAEWSEDFETKSKFKQMAKKALQGLENTQTEELLKGKKGPCFIATSIYGSPDAPDVLLLKDYRDLYLSKKILGKWMIKKYYKFSPYLADILKKSKLLMKVTEVMIVKPIIRLIKNSINQMKVQ